MADISVQKKDKGTGTDLTWAWAAGAIVAVVALMAWLFLNQDTTTQMVTGPSPADTVAAADPAGGAETVALGAVGAAPEQYVDRTVHIDDVPVTAVLGNRTFWADVPGGNPLLVNVAPTAGDAAWVVPNATADLIGTIRPVTEQEVDQWIQQGALLGEARVQATFATHFFQVTRVP